jgi:hypothetical protein
MLGAYRRNILFIINHLDCVAESGGFEPPIELLVL